LTRLDAVLTGQRPDPTAGAMHFLNPAIVRQRRGGSLPSWARGEGQPIGRHTFYSPDEGDAAPQRAALSLPKMANSTFMLTPRGAEKIGRFKRDEIFWRPDLLLMAHVGDTYSWKLPETPPEGQRAYRVLPCWTAP
jgi:hypothetical protein